MELFNAKWVISFKYIYIYIYNVSIRNVSVATDEGPGPKLALSEGGSRENIES